MATLIAVYNSGGCVGRCDAKCYNANSADCDCICGGKNHGAGKERAIEYTRELADTWIGKEGTGKATWGRVDHPSRDEVAFRS